MANFYFNPPPCEGDGERTGYVTEILGISIHAPV